MNAIKGYKVYMWISDEKIITEKLFTSANLLEARRKAFNFADNLIDVMDEAKKAGVIKYHSAEEILNPDTKLESIVIGNVHVTVVYENIKDGTAQTEEDLIYMPVANEGSPIEVPVEGSTTVKIINRETFDILDWETIKIHNREAEFYLQNGGHEGIKMITAAENSLYLLLDDYKRLCEKGLLNTTLDRKANAEMV